MIDKDHLHILYSAHVLKQNTKDAIYEIEEQAIATAINTAANTGEKSCLYTHDISKQTQNKLIDQGYTLYPRRLAPTASVQYEISWRDNDAK